ncbi:YwpF family protein, partial [Mesobacillus selenatarsenatis]
MKTFKLISMQLADDDALVDIEMEDGLIINKEDEKGTWLVEVFADHKYIPYFQDA